MNQKFLKCEHCGNMVAVVKETGVPVMCCGEAMKEIIPGTVDASLEKHVPVYRVEGNKVIVNVGAVEHMGRAGRNHPGFGQSKILIDKETHTAKEHDYQ